MRKLKAALPVFPGFYGTFFESDEEPFIDEGKTYDDYEWHYKEYMDEVGNSCVNAIESKLNELGFDLSITYNQMYSPREYNFANDAVLAYYKLKPGCIGKIKEYINKNSENFAIYLEENFKSRSGFCSFYSYHVSDWLKFINFRSFEYNEIYLEHLLNFILTNEEYDSMQLYYDTIERYGISICGSLIEPEEEIEETEPEIGKLWSYTSVLEFIFPESYNPNQLKLNL